MAISFPVILNLTITFKGAFEFKIKYEDVSMNLFLTYLRQGTIRQLSYQFLIRFENFANTKCNVVVNVHLKS